MLGFLQIRNGIKITMLDKSIGISSVKVRLSLQVNIGIQVKVAAGIYLKNKNGINLNT